MTARVVLFVGGPWDGRLEAVRPEHGTIVVAENVDVPLAQYQAESVSPTDEVAIRRSYYRSERISLFARRAEVYVHEGLRSQEAKGEALARHLLSPLALALTGGYGGLS